MDAVYTPPLRTITGAILAVFSQRTVSFALVAKLLPIAAHRVKLSRASAPLRTRVLPAIFLACASCKT